MYLLDVSNKYHMDATTKCQTRNLNTRCDRNFANRYKICMISFCTAKYNKIHFLWSTCSFLWSCGNWSVLSHSNKSVSDLICMSSIGIALEWFFFSHNTSWQNILPVKSGKHWKVSCWFYLFWGQTSCSETLNS